MQYLSTRRQVRLRLRWYFGRGGVCAYRFYVCDAINSKSHFTCREVREFLRDICSLDARFLGSRVNKIKLMRIDQTSPHVFLGRSCAVHFDAHGPYTRCYYHCSLTPDLTFKKKPILYICDVFFYVRARYTREMLGKSKISWNVTLRTYCLRKGNFRSSFVACINVIGGLNYYSNNATPKIY